MVFLLFMNSPLYKVTPYSQSLVFTLVSEHITVPLLFLGQPWFSINSYGLFKISCLIEKLHEMDMTGRYLSFFP